MTFSSQVFLDWLICLGFNHINRSKALWIPDESNLFWYRKVPPLIIRSRACLNFSHAISMNHTHFLFLFDLQHANSFESLVITCTIKPTIHKYRQTKPKVRLASSFSSLCFFVFLNRSIRSREKDANPNFTFIRIFRTNLSAVWILSGFTVRCLSVRILSVSILSGVRILSGFLEKRLSGVCLSGLCLSRFCPVSGFCPDFWKKLCPLSVCPAGQGQDRAVRIFAVLVRRRLPSFGNKNAFSSDVV